MRACGGVVLLRCQRREKKGRDRETAGYNRQLQTSQELAEAQGFCSPENRESVKAQRCQRHLHTEGICSKREEVIWKS